MVAALNPDDSLVIVDVQRDFCPGGALPVPDGDAVVPALNRWAVEAARASIPVVASRDWHPARHVSFRERGGPWPPHCLQDTPGAQFHPGLRLPPGTIVVSKGSDPDRDAYSAFDGTDLEARLTSSGVRRLWVGGFALDYCVRATVLGALERGFEARLIREATRPVDVSPGDGERAVEDMVRAGAVVEEAPLR